MNWYVHVDSVDFNFCGQAMTLLLMLPYHHKTFMKEIHTYTHHQSHNRTDARLNTPFVRINLQSYESASLARLNLHSYDWHSVVPHNTQSHDLTSIRTNQPSFVRINFIRTTEPSFVRLAFIRTIGLQSCDTRTVACIHLVVGLNRTHIQSHTHSRTTQSHDTPSRTAQSRDRLRRMTQSHDSSSRTALSHGQTQSRRTA